MTAERDPAAPWLAAHRDEVLAAWRGLLFSRMPHGAVPHLQNPDPFANPFGHRIHAATEAVLSGLAAGVPCETLAPALEPLMRVQAIQGNAASEAVAFVPLLHAAARQVPGGVPEEQAAALRERVDALLLVAFDVYTRCREDFHEIRVRAARRRVSTLLDRLAAGDEVDGEGTAPEACGSR